MNVIIVHGAFGYPEENWFGWMKYQLNQAGITCVVPALPTPEGQNLQNWLDIFNQAALSTITNKTILIGHSLGAAFILRWLERHPIQVAAVILVGVFIQPVGIEKFDEINKSFIEPPFDWKLIKSTHNKFTCVYGSDDPYVETTQFEYISEQLSAKKMLISGGGHLNSQSGFSGFPQLLNYVLLHSNLKNIF